MKHEYFNRMNDVLVNATKAFHTAIEASGMQPPDAIIPGVLQRFSPTGKHGDTAGWYVFYDDGIPAGAFGNWRDGSSINWCSKADHEMTDTERDAHRQRMEAARQQRDADKAAQQEATAQAAKTRWDASQPATSHPYLTAKRIKPHVARIDGDTLLIPMRDVHGKLWNLQQVFPDGTKRFLSGGKVSGCYCAIGKPDGELVIAEGFATGATIFESTGKAVAVAFSANNLPKVALALRARYPGMHIIIAADDDHQTAGNPGLLKGTEAAQAVGGWLAKPLFPPERGEKDTDFNDLARLVDAGAVVASFGAAVYFGDEKSQHQGDKPSTVPSESVFPEIKGRPQYVVLDDFVKDATGKQQHRPGVYHCGVKVNKQTGEPEGMFNNWICSPLHIDAITFDSQSNNFGRLLRFKTTVGKWREWAMPMELLAGDGTQLRAELLAMGVALDPGSAKFQLPVYLQWKEPKRQMHCALQVGWCGESFVLPDTVIGPQAAGVIFQSGERGHDEHTQAGTMEGWREGIAAKAVGNKLLTLAVSASFAGPLLARCNAEGGGIHFVGDSSTGKTTLIEGGCATWGGPGFKRSWRATANGMEGAAAMFNDCLLALDEISECDPKEVGAIVYALSNGRGKQRASRTGAARGITKWKCFVVSSGERTIATAMSEGGHRAKAGQSVRLLDIPVAQTFGAWDDLHGATSPAAFSDAIKRAAVQHHGHAGRAFLEKLTRDTADYCAELEKIKALDCFKTDGTDGQEKRAAARFALIGMAGELATEYSITGWAPGDAVKAAATAFKLWQGTRKKGNSEQYQIAEKVQGFIERHGDSRFSDVDGTHESVVRDRAGYWRNTSSGREYLFNAEGMREALKGFDFKRALDALEATGALPAPGSDGKRARFYRAAGVGVKLYPINPEKLGGTHGA